MITKPVLIIMAAGMGSRYGGLKQIDPLTDQGEIILDFSLYDAMRAGFSDVIFIIKKDNEEDFRALIDWRSGKHLNVQYAFQDINDLPGVYAADISKVKEAISEGRIKPWGTGHAVLSARELVRGPFAVINADDFYGRAAFKEMYDFLASAEDGEKYSYAMVGYRLDMALSETDHVSRGVCTLSKDGMLQDIVERTMIKRQPDGAIGFSEDQGATWTTLPDDTPVSMNFWGFTKGMMDELRKGFPSALSKILESNPAKGEYYLPGAVDALLKEDKAEVKVLFSQDKWYGVTYQEDKPGVKAAIEAMKAKGDYPEKLWD